MHRRSRCLTVLPFLLVSYACSKGGGGTAASLQVVDILAPANELQHGGTLALQASARFSDGTRDDVTTQSAWSSSDASVATVDAATGVVTSTGISGSVTIRATFRGLTGSTDLDVPLTFTGSAIFGAASTHQVVAADFDRDGVTDLAMIGTDAVVVALGNGAGLFTPLAPQAITADSNRAPAAVGDFNGDARVDLLVPNATDLQRLGGNGDGSFSIDAVPLNGADRSSLAGIEAVFADDIDGDGQLDFATLHAQGTVVRVFLQVFPGFDLPTDEPNPGTANSGSVVGDFDRDGAIDLLLAGTDGGERLLCRTDLGDVSSPLPAVQGAATYRLAAADLDADGILDVVVAASTGQVSWLRGAGNGSFTLAQTFPIGAAGVATPIAIADFDRDGDLDVAVGAGGAGILMLAAARPGVFGPAGRIAQASPATSLAVLDLDRDGQLDLAASNPAANRGTLLRGTTPKTGAGDLVPAIRVPIPGGSDVFASALQLADVNRDGWLDVVFATPGRQAVTIALGDGRGGLSAPIDHVMGDAMNGLGIVDLDRDGTLDLAISSGSGFYVASGDGVGGFGPDQNVAGALGPFLTIIDANRDGALDLVGSGPFQNDLTTAFGDGAGGFTMSTRVLTGVSQVHPGDFDRDGFVDRLYQVSTSALAILLGPGQNGTATSIPITGSAGEMQVADFDDDGILDFATVHFDQVIEIRFGNGDGTFATPSLVIPGSGFGLIEVKAADLDHDGVTDLVFMNWATVLDSYRVVYRRGLGNRQFGDAVPSPEFPDARALALGDIDRDGRIDAVLVAGAPDNAIHVLFNRAPQ